MKKLFTIILVLTFTLIPATALADTTYFEEDFESYPADVGFYPPTFMDYSAPPYNASVVNQGGSQMFWVQNYNPTSLDNGVSANEAIISPIHGDETQLTLSFTFMTMLEDGEVLMQLLVPYHMLSVSVLPDGSIFAPSIGLMAPPGTVIPGVFYDVTVIINLVTSTADIFVNGTQYGFDVPCAIAVDAGTGLMLVALDFDNTNAQSAAMYVDNIMLTGLYTEPAPNPRTGDSGSNGFIYAIISAFILVIAGFMVKRMASACEE